MSNSDTTMFVALPGSQEYAQMPRSQVKAKLAKGDLRQSSLIWSAKHNEWRPAKAMSQLIGMPASQQPASLKAKVKVRPTGPVPKVADKIPAAAPAAARKGAAPAARPASVTPAPAARAASTPAENLVVETPPSRMGYVVKLVCSVLVVLMLAALGLNWYFVQRPFAEAFAAKAPQFGQTSFFAHLGGFFQPGTLIVQIHGTEGVTAENFPAFVAALAQASPPGMGKFGQYDIVALGGLFSKDLYLKGADWAQLAEGKIAPQEVKGFLMEKGYMSAQEKITPRTNLNYEKQQALVESNWKAVVNRFVKK